MKDLYSIGEVAKIKGITVKALRYYHEKGILNPRYIDSNSGYRYYSIDQFIDIDIIKFSRSIGTTIKELQDIFTNPTTEKLHEYLQSKKNQALEIARNMKDISENIDALNSRLLEDDYSGNKICNDVTEEIVEERYLLITDFQEQGQLSELLHFSRLDKELTKRKIKWTFSSGVIYSLNSKDKLNYKYAFYTIDRKDYKKDNNNFYILPKGKYASIIYNNHNEEEQVKKLIEYLNNKGISYNEAIEVELYTDIFNRNTYQCKLQVLCEEL